MQASKLMFSEEELRRVENSEWILTKNSIIKKMMIVFGELSESYKQLVEQYQSALPQEVFQLSPKISKGEQHQGLPYIMLDYPRVFTKDDVFAIRTFFWWGNYFSLTLHLKGKFLDQLYDGICNNLETLAENQFYVSRSDNEWAHEIHEDTYTPLNKEGIQLIKMSKSENGFVKLVCKWPLEKANAVHALLEEQYAKLLKIIAG